MTTLILNFSQKVKIVTILIVDFASIDDVGYELFTKK
jgi:hypothetical protein